MALSHSDLKTRPWTKAIATATAVVTGNCRIMGLLVTAGADAASVTVYNATATSGTDILKVSAAANTTGYISLAPNGTRFSTGLSIAQTGTSPNIAVFYIAE